MGPRGVCEAPARKLPVPRLDAQHSSQWGGIGQYELNGFVLALGDYDISAGDIDEWIFSVNAPRGMKTLPRRFFATRIVPRRNAHIRAFAAETLSAITLLGFFVDVVVQPVAVSGDRLS